MRQLLFSSGSAIHTLADYELIRQIGRGAYGEVWLARNVTGSFVALKLVRRSAFDHHRPFEREFTGIRHFEPISHSESQVCILHVGRGDEFFYYVMELADDASTGAPLVPQGNDTRETEKQIAAYLPKTLKRLLCDQGHLAPDLCVTIALSLCRALVHLHRNGLVHRDVKPSNVIFVQGAARLADIGLVSSIDATRSFNVGTEGYILPDAPGTPRADLYSLGKVLYEMSTGCDRNQFPALPADFASRPDREVLAEINAIVVRACHRDPKLCYPDAEAILADLERIHRGQSVRRARRIGGLRAVGTRAALFLAVFASAAALIYRVPSFQVLFRPLPEGPNSTNIDANAACTKGLLILRGDNYREFAAAYTNFNEAIRLDPNFARPYIGLLELRAREMVVGIPDVSPETIPGIAQNLTRLAPRMAATHAARGIVQWSQGNYQEAEQSLLKAVEANPNDEFIHTWYGWLLLCLGRPGDSLKQAQISLTLAPSKGIVYRALGNVEYAKREYRRAIVQYKRALYWQPQESSSYHCIGIAMEAMGDYYNALTNLEQADLLSGLDPGQTRRTFDTLRQALATGGTNAFWRQNWEWNKAEDNPSYYWKATIQMHLGQPEEALRWLEIACAHRTRTYMDPLNTLLLDDWWDGLRGYPRFIALLKALGYMPEVK